MLGQRAELCVFYHNFAHQANLTASLVNSTSAASADHKLLPLLVPSGRNSGATVVEHFAQIMCKILYIGLDKLSIHLF
jgi:hypothetical protein